MEESRKTMRLVLEDGSVWTGTGFGGQGTVFGEVVFNTSLTGYQEILTDPSYAGQIVVMTAPQIGNTGITLKDHESSRSHLRGLVVRDLSPRVSNWRAETDLPAYLEAQGVIGASDIDTRAITRRLRHQGVQKGLLTDDDSRSDTDLLDEAQAWPGLDSVDLVQNVTCGSPYVWEEPTDEQWEFSRLRAYGEQQIDQPFEIVAYDFGIKRNILRRLTALGCRVVIVPAMTPASDVLAMKPDGVFLSNGPGDPSVITYGIEAAREIMGQVPVFGICLGHQILGQALGGKTYKLKFGHHGGNQPVKDLETGRVAISAHNHNYAVDPITLPHDVVVTHINLNDGCNEGFRHKTLPVMSVQYHPEAAPGPHDADPLFERFVQMMSKHG